MKLKILYDHQIFEQRFGGISNCFAKKIDLLRCKKDIEIALPIKYHNNAHLNQIDCYRQDLKGSRGEFLKKIIGKKRYSKFTKNTNQKLINESLEKDDFDVFHPTYYDPYFLNKIGNKPFVIDIHDMIPEIFIEYFDIKNSLFKEKKILVERAAKIIAISHHTKNDLINFFNIDKDKIDVIYHGNTFEGINIDAVNSGIDVPKKYILFTGNRSGYKNFYFFLMAIRQVLLDDSDLKFVCTGSPLSKAEVKYINDIGLANKVIHFCVDKDEEMIWLYKNAKVFAFPSLYEGFGLPILEAFSCRCPLVASNVSALPEIAQDAAIYFDPKSYQSIKNAVEKVLYDEDVRSDLINKGLRRLQDFSWRSNIDLTINLYNKLVGSRGR